MDFDRYKTNYCREEIIRTRQLLVFSHTSALYDATVHHIKRPVLVPLGMGMAIQTGYWPRLANEYLRDYQRQVEFAPNSYSL